MSDAGDAWLTKFESADADVDALLDALADVPADERRTALRRLLRAYRAKRALLDIVQSLGTSLEHDLLIPKIVAAAARLLHADRASLFIVDPIAGELWSKVAQGVEAKEIRFPITQGIAGHVARTGESVNVDDAYTHPLFNQEIDRKTGYRTKSLCVAPVKDSNARVIAVLQLINHQEGRFRRAEEELTRGLVGVLGLLLENAALFSDLRDQTNELSALLDVANSLSSSLDVDELIGRVMTSAAELLDADRASLFLLDRDRRELWSKVAQGMGTAEIRFPMDRGIAGHVAMTGQTLNLTDAYEHPLFNQEIDRQTGYRTRTLLTMALRDASGQVTGVTQVINGKRGLFDPADERLLGAFSAQAGVAIDNARLYERVRAMKDYLESILRSITNGVVSVARDGAIEMMNAAAATIFELDAAVVVGRPFGDVFGSLAAEIVPAVTRVISRGEPSLFYDVECRTTSGKSGSININVVPLTGPTGDPLGAVVVVEDITREKRIKNNLSRYMSKDLVERLLAGGQMALGGVRQEVTILFSDIRSFTTLAESMDAAEVVAMLNEYFGYMVDAIFKFDGVLDKYIGDAIMAVFGLPFADPRVDAKKAVNAAIEMQRELARLNDMRKKRGQFPIKTGIGLSTGEVLCGNIGSDKRMEYTVIGDGVNLASRLEGATKLYGAGVLISEYTRVRLDDQFILRDLDRIRVKGKNQPVAIYEVVARSNASINAETMDRLTCHARALELYRGRAFGEALSSFRAAHGAYPDDVTFELYIERCEWFLENPPMVDWDGTWTLTEK